MVSPLSQNRTYCIVSMQSRSRADEKTYGTVSVLESLEAGTHGVPNTRTSPLEDRLGGLDNYIPKLLVLLTKDEGDATGLSVVGGGREREDLSDDLLNTVVGNRRSVLKSVNGSSVLGSSEELIGGDGGRHCCDCNWKVRDED